MTCHQPVNTIPIVVNSEMIDSPGELLHMKDLLPKRVTI